MKRYQKFAATIFLFTILISCCTTEPILIDENIKLTEIDAAVIETYLNIHVENPSTGKEVVLERNGQRVMSFTAAADTVITDTGLTENTVYMYKAKLTEKGNVIGESREVRVRTMQPTSHEFTWQTFVLGDRTSALYDVAIINENNIWAVGEIYMKDSTGQIDPQFYNLARWDGNKWNFEKVFYYDQETPYLAHLKSIFAFNQNDVSLGGFIHWDGGKYESIPLYISFPSDANKIWGTSSKDLYIVGNNGNIAHYNGTRWQKIESTSDVSLTDIYGDETGQNIFISGYIDFKPTILLKYNNGKIEKIIESTDLFTNRQDYISGTLRSIWFNKKRLFTLTTLGLYISGISTNGEGNNLWKGSPYEWGVSSIRGNDINDIMTCGVFGRIWHYNGVSWKLYNELVSQIDELHRIEIKGNVCVTVGLRYINGIERYGLIHIGQR